MRSGGGIQYPFGRLFALFAMKTVCAILVCSLAVALAIHTSEQDDLINKNLNECRKELNLTDPEKMKDAVIAQGEHGSASCLMFCMQKKLGIFNEDGTLNKEMIIANVMREAPERKEAFEKRIETCEKTVKPVDGCKMAACFLPVEPPHA